MDSEITHCAPDNTGQSQMAMVLLASASISVRRTLGPLYFPPNSQLSASGGESEELWMVGRRKKERKRREKGRERRRERQRECGMGKISTSVYS